jgi:hypothetical protein
LITLIYILLASLEFFFINWMGRLSISSGYYQITFIQRVEDAPLFNVVFRILAPTVFLVLIATLFYAIGFEGDLGQFWIVTVYYFALRWSYNLMMGRNALLNWPKQIITATLGIGLSYLAAKYILVYREALLPSGRGLTDQLWIVIIGFIYVSATRVAWPGIGSSAEERRAKYLRHQFDLAHRRFGHVIASAASSRAAEALSYAVLLYESFNRPPLYQAIERNLLFPAGLAQSLGPMQVPTQLALEDSDLVRLGVEKMNAAFESGLTDFLAASEDARRSAAHGADDNDLLGLPPVFARLQTYYQDEVIHRAASQYNARSDYPREVAGIFAFLRSDHFSELNPEVRAARRKAAALAAVR